VRVDLRKVASIDAALDEIGGPIDALFACAGIANDGVPLMQVNFIGHRHLIETAIARKLLRPGSAIAGIASIGGLGWDRNTKLIRELLETGDFDAATEWIAARPELAHYTFSKQVMIAYCAAPWLMPGIGPMHRSGAAADGRHFEAVPAGDGCRRRRRSSRRHRCVLGAAAVADGAQRRALRRRRDDGGVAG
jgi:hypothetical protein